MKPADHTALVREARRLEAARQARWNPEGLDWSARPRGRLARVLALLAHYRYRLVAENEYLHRTLGWFARPADAKATVLRMCARLDAWDGNGALPADCWPEGADAALHGPRRYYRWLDEHDRWQRVDD
jgi:hypothetical protein